MRHSQFEGTQGEKSEFILSKHAEQTLIISVNNETLLIPAKPCSYRICEAVILWHKGNCF